LVVIQHGKDGRDGRRCSGFTVTWLEDGAVEVLTDDITISVKAALSGPVECLTFALAL
jgi:hypothetical protein